MLLSIALHSISSSWKWQRCRFRFEKKRIAACKPIGTSYILELNCRYETKWQSLVELNNAAANSACDLAKMCKAQNDGRYSRVRNTMMPSVSFAQFADSLLVSRCFFLLLSRHVYSNGGSLVILIENNACYALYYNARDKYFSTEAVNRLVWKNSFGMPLENRKIECFASFVAVCSFAHSLIPSFTLAFALSRHISLLYFLSFSSSLSHCLSRVIWLLKIFSFREFGVRFECVPARVQSFRTVFSATILYADVSRKCRNENDSLVLYAP